MAGSYEQAQAYGQNTLDSLTGAADRNKAADAYGDQKELANQQYADTQKLNDTLSKVQASRLQNQKNLQSTYNTNVSGAFQPYINGARNAQNQSNADRTAQQGVYKAADANVGQLMNRAGADQKAGLTVGQAMDPNNRIAQGQQQLYQGQGKQFQDLARKNLQMPGNMAPQGMNPALFASVNSSNAGQAYAQTQKRMDDMKNQGYMQGIVESQKSSQRGMDAGTRSRALANQRQLMQGNQMKSQQSMRGESEGLAKTERDALLDRRSRILDPATQNMAKQFSTDQAGRQVAAINQQVGGNSAANVGQAQAYSGDTGYLGAILGGAGGYMGAQAKAPAAAAPAAAAPAAAPAATVNPGYAGYASPNYLSTYQNQNAYGGPR